MDTLLTKKDTRNLKAIAVMLMLMHHLWAFPDRIAGGELKSCFKMFNTSLAEHIGYFGKICVSMFFFLGGYGIYISCKDKKYDLVGKIKKLYIAYWRVFLIFVPIGFIFFSNQDKYCEANNIHDCFKVFSKTEFLSNFFAIQSTYNCEWWFLFSYIISLVTFPLVKHICEKNSASVNIALIFIAYFTLQYIMPQIGDLEVLGKMNSHYIYKALWHRRSPYVSCFWVGIVVAKDGLLTKLYQSMKYHKLLNPLYDIIALMGIFYLREKGIMSFLDILYVPIIVVIIKDFLSKTKIINFILDKIGKESTNIWLIHSFFCYYFYGVVKIVVAPKYAILSFLILLAFSYIASVCVTCFWNILGSIKKKLFPAI